MPDPTNIKDDQFAAAEADLISRFGEKVQYINVPVQDVILPNGESVVHLVEQLACSGHDKLEDAHGCIDKHHEFMFGSMDEFQKAGDAVIKDRKPGLVIGKFRIVILKQVVTIVEESRK